MYGATVNTTEAGSKTGRSDATRADAERRLRELRRVRAVLWPDRDDPRVLSELVSVQGQVLAVEIELGRTACPGSHDLTAVVVVSGCL